MSNPERDELYEKIVQEILQENKKKHEAELNKKVRTKIFFIGIVVATLILILVAKTLAWFNNGKMAKVESLSITVQDVPSLQIAGFPSGGQWQANLSVSYYPLLAICGDGDHFFEPLLGKVNVSTSTYYEALKIKMTGATEIPDEKVSSHALVKEFELKSSISTAKPIYIEPGSTLSPDVESSIGSSINSDGLNTAMIAGAMRVAFYYWDDNESKYYLSTIWFPNPNIELVESDGIWSVPSAAIQPDGSVIATGTPEETYKLVTSAGLYADSSIGIKEITYSDDGYYIDTETGIKYVWDLQKFYNASQYVFDSLAPNVEKRYKLVIWVEATDRECENALLGGKMGLNLAFTQKAPND